MADERRLARMRIRFARWLAPELAKQEERASRLWHLAESLRTWNAGHVPIASLCGQWILDHDANYWRSLDEQPVGNLPGDISGFREHLKRLARPSPAPGEMNNG